MQIKEIFLEANPFNFEFQVFQNQQFINSGIISPIWGSNSFGDVRNINNQDDNYQRSQTYQESNSKGVKRKSVNNNNYSNKNYYKKKKANTSEVDKNETYDASVIKSLKSENSKLQLELDSKEMLKEETEQSLNKTIEENSRKLITLNRKLLTKEALIQDLELNNNKSKESALLLKLKNRDMEDDIKNLRSKHELNVQQIKP